VRHDTSRLRRVRGRARGALLGLRRNTAPISRHWGFDRGTPIDRYFIERFLAEHRDDIRGDVLEVMDNRYADAFGSDVRVADVLDIDPENPRATVVGDLTLPESLPERRYDCFVLTQTLQFTFDVAAAVRSVARVLRPSGVALVTLPSVSKIAPSAGVDRDFWRFTSASSRELFRQRFEEVDVRAYGNVLTCAAFLYGFATEELTQRELDEHDVLFPMLIAVRASGSR
jgi:SAM-dependent methyltransferase